MNNHLIRLDRNPRLKNAALKNFVPSGVSTHMPSPNPALAVASGFKVRELSGLRKTAAHRQPGYLEACLKLGTLDATGQYVTFSRQAFAEIHAKYSLQSAPIKIIKPCC